MRHSFAPARILVTGASGGLGGALARHYARHGVRLRLWGRDTARLTAIAEDCHALGAEVHIRSVDLTDIQAALAALVEDDSRDQFDLCLIASGRGDVRAAGDLVEDAAMVAQLGAVNFTAPTALSAALAQRMAERGSGRIILIGSAAAFHPLPFAAAYSSTKAGLARFAEALRIGVAPHGVSVTLISPGFIDTAAAHQVPGPKPMLMTPESVALRIAEAASRRQAHLILPWPFVVMHWLDRLLPRALHHSIVARLKPPG